MLLDLLFGAVLFFLPDWFRLLNGREAMGSFSLMSFVRAFFNRLNPLAACLAPTPVSPEDQVRSWRKRRRNSWGRPQHGTDTARLRSEAAFLTLGAEGTGTAMADPRGIQQSY